MVERHAARNLAFGGAPLQCGLEEGGRLLELGRRGSEIRDRRAQVVEDAGAPSVLGVLVEMGERLAERGAGAAEVRGGTGASVEDRRVVQEARAALFRIKRELAPRLPEVVGEGGGGLRVAAVPKLLLDAEPLREGGYRIPSEGLAKVPAEALGSLLPSALLRRDDSVPGWACCLRSRRPAFSSAWPDRSAAPPPAAADTSAGA
jgi:hypothetical protein